MASAPEELAALSQLVDAPVVAAERAAWGFENQTDLVTLADGRRLVVQRITRRFFAPARLALARDVPPRVRAAGIPAPLLLAGDADNDPPFVVREYLPGTPANALLALEATAVLLAQAMGALLLRLAALDSSTLGLPRTWSAPNLLAAAMRERLDSCAALLDADARMLLATVLDELPGRFADRPAVFAHGDFCPVNALVLDQDDYDAKGQGQASGRPSPETPFSSETGLGLIDFDEARLADPLFDAAWWGWVVRYHHPERWQAAWPHFLAAAGIAWNAENAERVRSLQLLRLLEALDDACAHQPAAAPGWAERLNLAVAWR